MIYIYVRGLMFPLSSRYRSFKGRTSYLFVHSPFDHDQIQAARTSSIE